MKTSFDFENLASFRRLIENVRAGKSCSCFGVVQPAKLAITAALGKKLVYLVADERRVKEVAEGFEIMGFKVKVFPRVPDEFLVRKFVSIDAFKERSKTLFSMIFEDYDVIVAQISALFSSVSPAKKFKENIICLKPGESVEPAELERRLALAGYRRQEIVAAAGEFSRRGDTVDICLAGDEELVRIDFFDTEIEGISVLDGATYKSVRELNEIKICPCTDLFLSTEEWADLEEKLNAERNAGEVSAENEANFYLAIDEAISRAARRENSYSSCFLKGYAGEFSSVFDYFSGSEVVVIDECKQVFDSMVSEGNALKARIKELLSSKIILKNSPKMFSDTEILEFLRKFTGIAFLKLTNSNRFFDSDVAISLAMNNSSKYTASRAELYADMRAYLDAGYKIFLFAGSEPNAAELESSLLSHDVDIKVNKSAKISDEKSAILPTGLPGGFILENEKIYVLGTGDIFPKTNRRQWLVGTENSAFVPRVGDFVVHEFHGIGICEGITRLDENFGKSEFIVVQYNKGDTLYVPTTSTDMLSRFSGADKPVKLSTLGGNEFLSIKEKVKKSVKKLAINLIKLYAERSAIKKIPFMEDTPLQTEFENSFCHTETFDQLTAIREIKADMQSEKVMDRLLAGDVGFGKTEVALRAAFKAIVEGRQVAFIAPTTILSEQHGKTARERMQNFGVKVEVLNRFKSKEKQREILSELEEGKIDLICGTHRLFSEDVKFKNLGLIVLDEEQKFGVEDKEKLKNKYKDVDYLTLSATPIPRTLSMSLSGIRDMSTIFSPPSERLPVTAVVAEYSDALLKDAILREISRGGQVFVLFSDVKHILGFAERVKKIAEDAKVFVAHGQMKPRELEDVMYKFYAGEADVLVCTTIIENGVDIKNANTLVVIDSDKFGLSSLYQIKGRVGRGSKSAYAYFTIPRDKVLTEEAYKRLDALLEFSDFGSGYNLSLRDIEIRGSGNIFGAEQSGHMQKIGLELYTKLLSNAVKEIRGEELLADRDVQIKLKVNAFIGQDYIAKTEEKLAVYKKISEISSPEAEEKVLLELAEIYGSVPEEVRVLADISLIRQILKRAGAVNMFESGNEIIVNFEDKKKITESEAMIEVIYKFRKNVIIETQDMARLKFVSFGTTRQGISLIKKFLLALKAK